MTNTIETKFFRVLAITFLALSATALPGCVTSYGPDGRPVGYAPAGPNTAIGAVGGAAAGGLIGSAAGGGTAGVVGGALLGGLVGGAAGNVLDNANRPRGCGYDYACQ